jgi:hypothetical protein
MARAWSDPVYKQWLLKDADAAIAEMGYGGLRGEHMVVVENSAKTHKLGRLHTLLVLSVAGLGPAACLVQVSAIPLARSH